MTIVRLHASHKDLVFELLCALDSESAHYRFGYRPGVWAIEKYVEKLDFEAGAFLGAFLEGQMVGLCEVIPLTPDGGIRELAFAVRAEHQGKGIGQLLGQAALKLANEGAVALCVVPNPPMARLAKKIGLVRVALDNESLPESMANVISSSYAGYATPRLLEESAV